MKRMSSWEVQQKLEARAAARAARAQARAERRIRWRTRGTALKTWIGTSQQTLVLSVGMALIVVMGLFPPWMERGYRDGYHAGDYAPIFDPPREARLDVARLGVQWVTVATFVGSLVLIFRRHR